MATFLCASQRTTRTKANWALPSVRGFAIPILMQQKPIREGGSREPPAFVR